MLGGKQQPVGQECRHRWPMGGVVWVASLPTFHDPYCECRAGWRHRAGRVSPAGGNGFSEAVQVVEVVVCGEELAAGRTDGGCLQGSTNHH